MLFLRQRKRMLVLKEQLDISNTSLIKAEDRLQLSDMETLKNDQIVLKHHTGTFKLSFA